MKMNDAPHEEADPLADAEAVEIKKYLKSKLIPERYEHVLSVCDLAIDLAKIYYADWQKVKLAALLHDCVKWMSPLELYEAALNYGIQVDEVQREKISLLHAPIGAELARELFGITDPEILNAIRNHTTGSGTMTLIDKIVWVADFAEPKRAHEEANLVRALAYKYLNRAVFEVSRYKIQDLLSKGGTIHPDTVDSYNNTLREISASAPVSNKTKHVKPVL